MREKACTDFGTNVGHTHIKFGYQIKVSATWAFCGAEVLQNDIKCLPVTEVWAHTLSLCSSASLQEELTLNNITESNTAEQNQEHNLYLSHSLAFFLSLTHSISSHSICHSVCYCATLSVSCCPSSSMSILIKLPLPLSLYLSHPVFWVNCICFSTCWISSKSCTDMLKCRM